MPTLDTSAYVTRLIAEAPPLTAAQRDRLASVLRPAPVAVVPR